MMQFKEDDSELENIAPKNNKKNNVE